MDISIIIPHFNSPLSLKKLLKSIPFMDNIEVIVIDDNSTKYIDELNELKNNEKFSHVKFFNNTSQNKGAGACRNIGIASSTSEWLLFADSDDFFLKDFYSHVAPFLTSHNDIVFFEPVSYDTLSGVESDRHLVYQKLIKDYLEIKNEETELRIRYEFFVPWSKLFNKKFVINHEIEFDEEIASNDVMFSVRAGQYMNNFEVTTCKIYCVTKTKGSLTMNMSEKTYDARVNVFIRYVNHMRSILDEKDLKYFQFRGSGYLVTIMKCKFGFKKLLYNYFLFKKAQIKIVDIKDFNPFNLFSKIKNQYLIYKKNKNYYVK